eukprot:1858459-Amphidinium_carterae.1
MSTLNQLLQEVGQIRKQTRTLSELSEKIDEHGNRLKDLELKMARIELNGTVSLFGSDAASSTLARLVSLEPNNSQTCN